MEKVMMKYKCNWCSHKFERMVGTYGDNSSKKSKVSSQVQCNHCGNFIKTWGEEIG